MTLKLYRGLAFGVPISIALWSAMALATILIIDHQRPGFLHVVRLMSINMAGLAH
jgi:hypothetical protein